MKNIRYTGRQQGDAFQEMLCAEAADEGTPAERLHALSKESEHIAIEVARNPSTAPETLKELARSESVLVRAALVQNPSVTKELLLLVLQRPHRVISRAVARYTHEREVIAKIAMVSTKQVKRALVANRGTSYETLRQVFQRWPTLGRDARQEWATLCSFDDEILSQCLWRIQTKIDPWLEYALIATARDEKTTPAMLRQLATLGSRSINTSLAMNPSTPREILDEWASVESREYAWALASNRNLSPNILERLAKNQGLRSALAGNPSTPMSLLSLYSKSKDYSVLSSLARNPRAPVEILEKLCKQNSVKWNLLSNPNLPLSVLRDLVNAGIPPGYREILEKQPNMTDELRWRMNVDEPAALRMAQDPSASAEIIARLAADNRFTSSQVRREILKHSNVSEDVLKGAMQRIKIPIEEKMCIAQNPSATAEILEALASLPGKNLRLLIAKHPNTSRETLEMLAKSKVTEIQEAALQALQR